MLLEAALAAHLALNQHWIQVLFIQFLFLFNKSQFFFFSYLLTPYMYSNTHTHHQSGPARGPHGRAPQLTLLHP
jgi:hypothetical protein